MYIDMHKKRIREGKEEEKKEKRSSIINFVIGHVPIVAIYPCRYSELNNLSTQELNFDSISVTSDSVSTSMTRFTSAVFRINSTAPAYIIRCEGLQFSGK
jgi:hypothetical protein